MQVLHIENCKTAKKSVRTVLTGRLCYVYGLEASVLLSVLPRFINGFNTIQNPRRIIFYRKRKKFRLILKCLWKYAEPRKSKAILKKNKVGRLGILTLRHYETPVIKTMWYLQKSQKIGLRNKEFRNNLPQI